MGTINELLTSVKSLNLRDEVPKIVQTTSFEIITINQLQLNAGADSDLAKLSRYRSRAYAEKKNRQNPKPGLYTPDLFLTGSFYRGMGVVMKGSTEFEIRSTDSKSDALEKKYGEKIFGLADKNRSVYATGVFFKSIKEYIEHRTGLQFK